MVLTLLNQCKDMKKNNWQAGDQLRKLLSCKILKHMRNTLLLLLITFFQSYATISYSQTTLLSLDLKDATVGSVLEKIEEQSDFYFLFNAKLVDIDRKVSVSVNNQKIFPVLDQLFTNTNVEYVVYNQQIVLSPGEYIGGLKSQAQQPRVITGMVTDENGDPMVGVTVMVKGTIQGTITDAEGKYSISNVPEDGILIFSFVGMKSQEVSINKQQTIDIVLSIDKLSLDEVIVIGYGTARLQDYPGSVSSLKMDGSALSLLPNLNALEPLKGNISGLNIGATNTAGGEPNILIRGQNSIYGSNNPLIVLDGIIYLGSLSDINPNDIASFDILKDAVSAAAFGSRSANGVIAITTKKGNIGKPVITYNMSSGIQLWQNQPTLMKGEEWISVVNARNGYTPGTTNWATSEGQLANFYAGNETDWLDKVTQTGVIQNYQIAVSGAEQQVNYYLSTSYSDNKGIVVGDNFNRISLLGKVNTSITDWLQVGLDANYSRRDYSGFAANMREAQASSPYGVMFRDDQGNLEKYPQSGSSINPLWGVDDGTRDNKDIRNNYRINAYTVIDVPWIKGLNFKMNLLSYVDKNQTGNFYYENYYVLEGEGLERYAPSTLVGFLSKANGNISTYNSSSYVWDNILNYKNSFKNHIIDVTLVATRDHYRYEELIMKGSDFAANGNTTLGMWGLLKATVQNIDMNGVERSNVGYLGRISYSFNGKYYFTSSYRRDGASVFGTNRKWGNFAAAGLAWRITNESFMRDIKLLNDLKIKLSLGQNGNQGISPYATLSTITNGAAANFDYEFSDAEGIRNYGLYQNALGNYDLGWEKTESWNTGFESIWLKRRLFVDMDIYFSKTTDQIFMRQIPVMTGFTTINTSMGQVNNSGIELTVKSINIQTTNLRWNTIVTFWKNNNKLIKLYGQDANEDGKEDDDIANSLFIGRSLGTIYGYQQDGIVQEIDTEYITLTGSAPGDPKYKDIDGVAGITADDRIFLGNDKENFRLNISNSINYKNFELYANITGVFGGNKYYLKSNPYAFKIAGTGRNIDNMIYKPYWTPENKSNVYPSATYAGDSRFMGLQSRGFVRLQDVSLSYSLNPYWLKAVRISSMKIFLSAKNLVIITKWVGGDPEIGAPVFQNIMPVPSTYLIGLNMSL